MFLKFFCYHFRKSARNFNAPMARAAKNVIVEVSSQIVFSKDKDYK